MREPPTSELLGHPSEILKSLALTRRVSQQVAKRDHQRLRSKLLVWSAADEGGIARLAKVYSILMARLDYSLSPSDVSAYLESLAYTLAARRTRLSWKSFAIASSVHELQNLASKLSKPVRSRGNPKLGYIFTGQGAQFAGMSKELLTFPVFLNSLRRSEMYLDHFGCQWSLLGVLSYCLFPMLTKSLHLATRSEIRYLSIVMRSLGRLLTVCLTELLSAMHSA